MVLWLAFIVDFFFLLFILLVFDLFLMLRSYCDDSEMNFRYCGRTCGHTSSSPLLLLPPPPPLPSSAFVWCQFEYEETLAAASRLSLSHRWVWEEEEVEEVEEECLLRSSS